MSTFPALSGKELLRVLSKLGFATMRVRGSHHFLKHEDGRSTIIPVHGNETLGPGLLSKILRECEIDRDALLRNF